ncbi:MAG: CpsD/CapB family tyrosine-protein kinase, partial [Gammaproteobacteria bacterium]|nr:CpsD/CapB family tyrosine-protein kinase [Gammaproteobacteria bacterium]
MDYIQQAIDKARDERQGNIGKQKDERSAGGIVSPEGISDAKAPKVVSGVPQEINYTKTRKIELDNDLLRENMIVAGFEHEKRAEVYRQLRTQVLQKLRGNGWKTLAVTSPNKNAGKTVTALNLAISLSKEVNQTVLLVDLDLRAPSVLKTLGIETEYGLVDHLRGEVSVADVMVNPGFERLVILPGKADENYSSEILSSPQMKALMDDLTNRYESRLIIFDLPALLVNDDALAFTPDVDSTLLVVEDG